MTDVDAVLFDLDDTLCEYRRTTEELIELSFDRVGVEPVFTVDDYHARYGDFVDVSETIQDLRKQCFAALADEAGKDPAVGERVAEVFSGERDHGNVRPLPGASAAVERLADVYRLAIVTNGAPEMQAAKLEALSFTDAFETVVYAGYDVPAKPDPAPFYRGLDVLGSAPEQAVHVGNSLESDVAGAAAAGVRSVWLGNGVETPRPAPDYRIESLEELRTPPWEPAR
ncbi:MAG: FMN phosphatase YigB (HAD superfamily) [Natrialbaceae archaeon]|jgi:FMN phosphatase YigB (HAD superfamily)